MRNFLFINLLSFGIPMITMGDEYGLSHDGNNNPYCHDDPINWINWDEVKASHNLLSFTSKLIALRKGIKLPTSATSNLYVFHRALAFLVEDRFLLAFNPFETAFDISGAFSGNFEILLATNEASNLIVPKYTCLIACRR